MKQPMKNGRNLSNISTQHHSRSFQSKKKERIVCDSSHAEIENMKKYSSQIDQCLMNVEQHWPQFQIDGTRNIWILKPGAKSRGRGLNISPFSSSSLMISLQELWSTIDWMTFLNYVHLH